MAPSDSRSVNRCAAGFTWPANFPINVTVPAAGAEHEAGLLVMGAYSHSRLREMLLGGATRHILKNASARPVLLAH